MSLASSANPAVKDLSVALRATVIDPSQVASAITGTMACTDAGVLLGASSVTNARASLTTRFMSAASRTITASFTATGAATGVDPAPLTQAVTAAGTTTTTITSITSTRPVANYGASGSIVATVKAVAPGAGVPTGGVDFSIDGGHHQSASVDATGKARLALADIYPACYPCSYTITASYTGDPSNNPSATATGVVQTLVGITTPPVSTVTANPKGQSTFSPTSFTMSSANPVGCNVTITNTAPLAIVHRDGLVELRRHPLQLALTS